MALVLPAAEYTRLPKYDSDEGAVHRPLLMIRGHQDVSADIRSSFKITEPRRKEIYEDDN